PVRLKLPGAIAMSTPTGRMTAARCIRYGSASIQRTQCPACASTRTGATDALAGLGDDVSEMIPDRSGHYLYWAVGSGPVMRLLRAPLSDLNAPQRLPLPEVDSFMLDATHIAFTQPQIRGLTLCDLATVGCESLPLPISGSTAGAWTLGEGSVWYLDQSTNPPTLARYDDAAKAVTLRSPAAPMAFGRTLAVAPGAAKLLLARAAPTQIDLMLVR
ncbi:MAG: hypothetical protein ABI440_03345, partial [Casimicrobiaceae bacterium]